jgi:putative ABC transport system permease protein
MNSTKLILRTLRHYPWSHLATSAGIAVATAIICGALIIGYSLTRSLEQIVEYRLGNITHTITAGERLFTGQLVYNIAQKEGLDITPILKADAIVSVQGSDARINRVQIWGVDTGFAEIAGGEWPQKEIEPGEVLVSENVAMRLGVATGDFILLRMRTINPILVIHLSFPMPDKPLPAGCRCAMCFHAISWGISICNRRKRHLLTSS